MRFLAPRARARAHTHTPPHTHFDTLTPRFLPRASNLIDDVTERTKTDRETERGGGTVR
jgi:hypothetical protein